MPYALSPLNPTSTIMYFSASLAFYHADNVTLYIWDTDFLCVSSTSTALQLHQQFQVSSPAGPWHLRKPKDMPGKLLLPYIPQPITVTVLREWGVILTVQRSNSMILQRQSGNPHFNHGSGYSDSSGDTFSFTVVTLSAKLCKIGQKPRCIINNDAIGPHGYWKSLVSNMIALQIHNSFGFGSAGKHYHFCQ